VGIRGIVCKQWSSLCPVVLVSVGTIGGIHCWLMAGRRCHVVVGREGYLDSVFFCGGKVLWAKACGKGGL
jgi:hypothetical protein